MKHASAATLQALEPLLSSLSALPGLVEKNPGIFYRNGTAFLHFHEDAAGLFADVKLAAPGFERRAVDTAVEQRALLEDICRRLAPAR